jgi:hypothetical protein
MAKTFRDKVDDYKDTVFAIIGFGNLFRFDNKTQSMDESVKLAQGREFRTSSSNRISPDNIVTPDLCIQIGNDKGIAAEVKISFPKNQEHWADDFNQLMKYDDNLENWWTADSKIQNHDIVLLPHPSRSVMVEEYFQKQSSQGEVKFERPFSIVEFNRSDQSNGYYFFRKRSGEMKADEEIAEKLKYGIQVPTEKLMLNYEKHKLYDSKPPMPYLLHIIWESIILRFASDSQDLSQSRKTKIEIVTSVEKITKELYDNCSFKGFNFDESDHQPKVPLTSWVRTAVHALVTFKYAEWINQSEGTCKIYFNKRLNDVFETFINLCLEHNIDTEDIEGSEYQEELFKSKNHRITNE